MRDHQWQRTARALERYARITNPILVALGIMLGMLDASVYFVSRLPHPATTPPELAAGGADAAQAPAADQPLKRPDSPPPARSPG